MGAGCEVGLTGGRCRWGAGVSLYDGGGCGTGAGRQGRSLRDGGEGRSGYAVGDVVGGEHRRGELGVGGGGDESGGEEGGGEKSGSQQKIWEKQIGRVGRAGGDGCAGGRAGGSGRSAGAGGGSGTVIKRSHGYGGLRGRGWFALGNVILCARAGARSVELRRANY